MLCTQCQTNWASENAPGMDCGVADEDVRDPPLLDSSPDGNSDEVVQVTSPAGT